MESKGDGSAKSRKRRNMWTTEAEKILFVVWARNLSGLRVSRMNHPVFVKMSHEMDALGYPYTVKEIKTKIHNLASKYRDERKLMRECGVRPSWTHYQTVHNIYGKGRIFRSEPEPESEDSGDDNSSDRNMSVRSEGIDVDYSSDNSNEDSMDEAVVTCMETMNRNMLSLIEHTHEQNKKSLDLQREMLEIQKERNEILVRMLDVFKNKWKKKNANEENAAAKKLKITETNAIENSDIAKTDAQNGHGGSCDITKVLDTQDMPLRDDSNINNSVAVATLSEIPNA